MRIALLGPLRVESEGRPVEIGGARLRVLLARLALSAGRPVPVDTLVDDLWGSEPPAEAGNALQSLVSRLRRALGDPAAIESGPGGYRLVVDAADVDLHRFETLLAEGREALAGGRAGEAEATLAEALGLCRGEPLAGLADAPFAAAEAARLADLTASAEEDFFDAALRLGKQADVLADLDAAGARHPLRERLAELRMRALAAAGRQSEALAVYESVRVRLADELGVDPSAGLRAAHLEILRGTRPGEPAAAERVPALPGWLTRFIGREDELAGLVDLLDRTRLVTLTGPGGAGKTRLATEVAGRHRLHRAGRVWFAALAGVRDPGDLAGAVLAALGGSEMRIPEQNPGSSGDTLDRVAEVLAGADALLILDNCEHLVDAAAELAHDLLLRLPVLRILATSREPLAIDGEAVYPLGPLATPDPEDALADAAATAAVRMFADRASSARPDFTLGEENIGAVTEICRRLDGMPLALELAAARLRSMSPEQIARRLDDRFRLLTSGSRVVLPRQRTLRAVVEWSWDLLEKPERALAERLSMFRDGAALDAVERVCVGDVLPDPDVLPVLGSLVDKSIVEAQTDGAGEPRYRMLETIRVFAAERLAAAGGQTAATERFIGYFADLATTNRPRMRTREQLDAIAIMDREYDNLLGALRMAIDDERVEDACWLLLGQFWYWMMKGDNDRTFAYVREIEAFGDRVPRDIRSGLRIISSLQDIGPGVRNMSGLRALIDEFHEAGSLLPLPELSVALPMLAFFSGDPKLAERELATVAASTDPWIRACGHWAESFVLAERGDFAGAQVAREAAFTAFSAIGDRWGIGVALGMMAQARSFTGDHDGAIAAYRKGLELASELGSAEDMVQQRWRLAMEYIRAGDLAKAREELSCAEALVSGHDVERNLMVLLGKAELARADGEVSRAWRLIGELETMLAGHWLADRMPKDWIAVQRGALAVAGGDFAAARRELVAGLPSAKERRDMPDLATGAEVLAMIRRGEGDPADAARALGLSEALRGTLDYGNPDIRRLLADLAGTLGEQASADYRAETASLSTKDAIARLLADLDAG